MARDFMRFFATLFIWGMVGGVMMALFVNESSPVASDDVVAVVMFLCVAAAASTAAVWFGGHTRTDGWVRGKGKRGRPRRAERLLETLEDDEIYDLEALLLAREHDVEHHQMGKSG